MLHEAISEALCGPEPDPDYDDLIGRRIQPKAPEFVGYEEPEEEGMRPDEIVAPRPRGSRLTTTRRRSR